MFYIVVARLTPWLKREAAHVSEWRTLDEHYAAGEFSLQLLGWVHPRRFVVIREQLRAERTSLGRKLLEVPGHTFLGRTSNLMERSYSRLFTGVADLLEQARKYSARSVNAIMASTY